MVSRKALVLWFMMAAAVYILLLLSRFNRHTHVDYSNIAKPSFTMLDEMKQRRSSGYLENIQLKNLLRYTKFLKSPDSPCKSPPKMVVLVQSACSNKEHRKSIRDTWGHRATSLEVPVVFFVGQCPGVKEEFREFGDMVEVDFVDSYVNNTLKSLARFKWYLEECANSEYLLMVDDDIVLMIDSLLDFLDNKIGYSIFGPLITGTVVRRKPSSKWYVPVWAYSGHEYPPHVGGSSYVVNGSAVRALYEASLEARFIAVDHVLFTGLVADMIGLHRVTDSYRFPVRKNKDIRCGSSSVYSVTHMTPREIRTYWAKRADICKLRF